MRTTSPENDWSIHYYMIYISSDRKLAVRSWLYVIELMWCELILWLDDRWTNGHVINDEWTGFDQLNRPTIHSIYCGGREFIFVGENNEFYCSITSSSLFLVCWNFRPAAVVATFSLPRGKVIFSYWRDWNTVWLGCGAMLQQLDVQVMRWLIDIAVNQSVLLEDGICDVRASISRGLSCSHVRRELCVYVHGMSSMLRPI